MVILMMVNGKKVNQKVEAFINPRVGVYMIKKEKMAIKSSMMHSNARIL